MYICWGALKRGMIDGCRKVICLDGCHLKTECGGILLTATRVDANNTMYPFAYAVVEKEKKKSWHWFLSLLKSDLSITNCEEWTLMSDKQKGLIDSVSEIFSGREHRFYVMHLYSNFKLSHKGLALKDLLWRAARSTRVVDFNKVMQELKERDVKAYEWLASRPPQNWSKSHFRTTSKCDILLNNFSESYNGVLAKARATTILNMMESIRMNLMEKIGQKKLKMIKWRGNICLRIADILEENKKRSMEFVAHWNGHEEFNVQKSAFDDTYKVHLGEQYCSCRRWQITGIPCAHAIRGMNFMNYRPEMYIHESYTTETYLKIYSNYMLPIGSVDEWPEKEDESIEILPPIVQKQPGRPKNFNRKLQMGEKKGKILPVNLTCGKLSKKGAPIHCGFCKQEGHNSRTCHLKVKNQIGDPSLDIPAPNVEKRQTKNKGKENQANAVAQCTGFEDYVNEIVYEAPNMKRKLDKSVIIEDTLLSNKAGRPPKQQVKRNCNKSEMDLGTSSLTGLTEPNYNKPNASSKVEDWLRCSMTQPVQSTSGGMEKLIIRMVAT